MATCAVFRWPNAALAALAALTCGGCGPVVEDYSARRALLDRVLEAERARSGDLTAIVAGLASSDAEIRERSALAAGRLRLDAARAELIRLARGDGPVARDIALWALGRLPNEAATETLLRDRAEKDGIGAAVESFVATSPSDVAHAALTAWLRSERDELRLAAVLALARRAGAGDSESRIDVGPLDGMLRDRIDAERDERIRWAIVHVLSRDDAASKAHAELFARSLDDHNLVVRGIARRALSRIGRAAPDPIPATGAASLPPTHDWIARIGPGETETFDAGRRRRIPCVIEVIGKGQMLLHLDVLNAPRGARAIVDLVLRGAFDCGALASADPFSALELAPSGAGPAPNEPLEVGPAPIRRGTLYTERSDANGKFRIALLPLPEREGRVAVIGRVVGGHALLEHLAAGDRVRLHVY